MNNLIKNIASIQTGLFAKPGGEGDFVYLQSRHFDENGKLVASLIPDLIDDGISEKHKLQHGDVLFAAKGSKNFAALYEGQNPPAVASTSFFVIRLSRSGIMPEFLTWYLNSPTVQSTLKAQARGTSIPSISKQVLESLEIPIPDLETQRKILHIEFLRDEESKIRNRIEALREKSIQYQINQALK